jgi:hypothetical protein
VLGTSAQETRITKEKRMRKENNERQKGGRSEEKEKIKNEAI